MTGSILLHSAPNIVGFFQSEFAKGLREEWTLPPKRQQENARLLPVI